MKTIEIKQKLVEEALDQLKAAQQDRYVQSTQNVIDELELALRQPPVVRQIEQIYCTCSRAKGIDHDEEGVPYCIECEKPVQ